MNSENLQELENTAIRVALEKMDNLPSGEVVVRPRMGTGGNFQDLFLWDTAFTVMWAMHIDALPAENSLDNFYRLRGADGFIYRQYNPEGRPKYLQPHPICFAPPLLSWAEMELCTLRGKWERLKKAYPVLAGHHARCRELFRMEDGLYTGCPLGCGMDNLPRWPRGWRDDGKGLRFARQHLAEDAVVNSWIEHLFKSDHYAWNLQGRFIDMSSQMALDARMLMEMAGRLGLKEEAAAWRREHEELGDLINARMWNDDIGAYVDLAYGQLQNRVHIGGFWPLLAGIVPSERLGRLVGLLEDPRHFNRPTPVPTLSASDPDYSEGGSYWLGGVWAPTNYMVMKGLALNGRGDLARQIAGRYVSAVWATYRETATLWENYDPEKPSRGNSAAPDFCGWTGLAAVSVPREFLMSKNEGNPRADDRSRAVRFATP